MMEKLTGDRPRMPNVKRNSTDYRCVDVVTQIITSFVIDGQVLIFFFSILLRVRSETNDNN